jgi:glycine cleavage system H lipoate-binding protein
MVVLLMLAMFLVFIGISYWREQAARRRMASSVSAAGAGAPGTKNLYLHPSHSFARIVAEDVVEVGMDEFSKHAFAFVEEIALPEKGLEVQQGDIAWKVRVGERTISQRIPVDGIIMEVNEKGGGDWLLKIKANHLAENLTNLIQGASVGQWLKMARAKFLMEHAGTLVPAMQDGGELVEGFARHLTDAQWREFGKEFFNCESN